MSVVPSLKSANGVFLAIEFFTIRNFWQNLADLPNENKSGEIQQIREKYMMDRRSTLKAWIRFTAQMS